MIPYATVITHIFSLFPISVCFYIYKYNFEQEALFLFFNLIFATLFSTFYHTYDYDSIKLKISDYETWSFLDHISAATVIIVTSLYTLRYRSQQLYLLCYIFKSIVIFCYMLLNPIFSYWIYIIIGFMMIARYKIVFDYFKKQFWLSCLTIITITCALIFYNIALEKDYKTWHSLWHVFVFISSGLLCISKHRMDKYYIQENNYNRAQSNSI